MMTQDGKSVHANDTANGTGIGCGVEFIYSGIDHFIDFESRSTNRDQGRLTGIGKLIFPDDKDNKKERLLLTFYLNGSYALYHCMDLDGLSNIKPLKYDSLLSKLSGSGHYMVCNQGAQTEATRNPIEITDMDRDRGWGISRRQTVNISVTNLLAKPGQTTAVSGEQSSEKRGNENWFFSLCQIKDKYFGAFSPCDGGLEKVVFNTGKFTATPLCPAVIRHCEGKIYINWATESGGSYSIHAISFGRTD